MVEPEFTWDKDTNALLSVLKMNNVNGGARILCPLFVLSIQHMGQGHERFIVCVKNEQVFKRLLAVNQG
jgi:hypothetical protein